MILNFAIFFMPVGRARNYLSRFFCHIAINTEFEEVLLTFCRQTCAVKALRFKVYSISKFLSMQIAFIGPYSKNLLILSSMEKYNRL